MNDFVVPNPETNSDISPVRLLEDAAEIKPDRAQQLIEASLMNPPLTEADGALYKQLAKVIAAAKESAGADTTWPGAPYTPEDRGPLNGHCGVLAYLVQQEFGGLVVQCQACFEDPQAASSLTVEQWELHVINLIPDAEGALRPFDGSASQYGQPDGVPPAKIKKPVLDTPEVDPTLPGRLAILSQRVRSHL